MWILLEFFFDRSDSQNPARTNPLVSIPTNPKKTRAALYGTKETDVAEDDSNDVVVASVLYLSVWNSEDVSSGQSTVDNIANPVPSINECSVNASRFTVFYKHVVLACTHLIRCRDVAQ